MKVFIEMDLYDFKAWQGGASTLRWLEDIDKLDEVQEMIEEGFPDGISECDLNDLLWFDVGVIEEWIGESYEEWLTDNKENNN